MFEMNEKELTWEEVRNNLNLTEEEEEEIRLEEEIIKATIEARKKNNLTQQELSELSGIKQPAIARIEKRKNSPQIYTLFKLLYPMGYTIKIVPLERVRNEKEEK